MSAPRAFFEPDGNAWRATVLTRGPWSPDFQHAGPPSALMAREVERAVGGAAFQVVRMTVEVLKPVPVATVAVRAEPVRAGRKVQEIAAQLSAADGTVLARATALAVRTTVLELPASGDPLVDPVPSPEASEAFEFTFFQEPVGYHTAMEARLARGRFWSGRIAVWMRMRLPLVPGETPTPLQRVMIAADSGNGVSAVLDPKRFTFMNPDLTVYLHRLPAGEWVCLDARTIPQSHGIGLADTRLLDERGPIGRGLQSLLIEERPPPR